MCTIKLNKEFKMQRTSRIGNDFIVQAKVIRKTDKAVLIEWTEKTEDNFIAEYKGVSLNCKKTWSDTIFNSWLPKTIFSDLKHWEKREVVYALDWNGKICYHDEEEKYPVIIEEGGYIFILPFWIDRKEK